MAGNFNYPFINQFVHGGQERHHDAGAGVAAAQYYGNPIFSQLNWMMQSQAAAHSPHTTFQSEEQNQQQQAQMQQHVQAQQQATSASSAAPSRITYQQSHNPVSNVPNDHNAQKSVSIEKEKTVFRCPDCSESFKHASGVFIHASQVHYATELQNAYWPEIELTNTCPLCSKSIDKTKYLAHVGGKHKKITAFMCNEKREAYLNIERQKLTIGRKRKRMMIGETKEIEDKFRCPDCDKPFMYVAPLYIHAATTHYNEQLKAKYLPIYREHGKCHLCGSVVTQTSLVSHFGGKHRRILTFMPEDKRQLYMSMKKRSWTNFRDTGGLACKYEACGKSFRNLTMYKQHLANTHVRTELLNQTRQTIKDARCSFCGKIMTKRYSLLQHIGTCHNQILNYVPPEVHKQLTQLGVKDETHE
jgi:uncharacterized C2H2 Zn-finger protein